MARAADCALEAAPPALLGRKLEKEPAREVMAEPTVLSREVLRAVLVACSCFRAEALRAPGATLLLDPALSREPREDTEVRAPAGLVDGGGMAAEACCT